VAGIVDVFVAARSQRSAAASPRERVHTVLAEICAISPVE